MKKEALLEGRSPLEAFIASTLAGGGGFAALRLLKEISNAAQPKRQPGENANSLTIDLPKTANAYMEANEGLTIPKLVALVAGLPLGFMGTKAVYDTVKGKQLQNEINKSNQKYLQTLGTFKQGEASDTPATDAFCAGLAGMLEKSAIVDGMDAFSDFKFRDDGIPHEHRKAITEAMLRKGFWGDALNGATLGLAKDVAAPVVGIGALLTALGVGTSMGLADKKKEKTEQSMRFPSTVKINEV
jgi:hypothetical protein